MHCDDAEVNAGEVRKLKRRIRELVEGGKKTLEKAVLTKAVKLAHKEKLISRTLLLLEDNSLLSAALRL